MSRVTVRTSRGRNASSAIGLLALFVILAAVGPWLFRRPGGVDWAAVLLYSGFVAFIGLLGATAAVLAWRPQTLLILDDRGLVLHGGRVVIPWEEIRGARTFTRAADGSRGLFALDDAMLHYVSVDVLYPERFDAHALGRLARKTEESLGLSGYHILVNGVDRSPEEIAGLIRAGAEVLGAGRGNR